MPDATPSSLHLAAPLDCTIVADARYDLEAYADGLRLAAQNLGPSFAAAVQMLLHCRGKALLIALGKSGHVARKAAATLSSTGTPAVFIHAAEALHGDLGLASPADVAVLVSHSGETQEVVRVARALRAAGVRTISLTRCAEATLAQICEAAIVVAPGPERCHLGLAPTVSTAAQLAILDAMALAVSRAKSFSREQFAQCHPGGSLGHALQSLPPDSLAA